MKVCSTCRTVRWPLPGGVYSCPRCDGAELIQNQGKWKADDYYANRPDTQLQRDVDEIIGPWLDTQAPYDWETDHDLW